MPTKKQIIIIGVLCIVVFGLGYWSSLPEKDSEQRVEADTPPVPTIITNIVTNVLREVVTNIVMVQPPVLEFNPIVEAEIRIELKKPTGEITKADLEEVTTLNLNGNQLTDVPNELEKLTQLTYLSFGGNKLTNVNRMEKLPQLTYLNLQNNKLTNVKGLEKLTKLTELWLGGNQLTGVKGLEKLTQLKSLDLRGNPDLTKAQIAELQKALLKCRILSNPTK